MLGGVSDDHQAGSLPLKVVCTPSLPVLAVVVFDIHSIYWMQ